MTTGSPLEGLSEKAEDRVLWLGTVTPSNRPALRPVWFVYLEEKLVVFSEPHAAKVRHLFANPEVVMTFHSDPSAGHIRVVSGRAEVSLDGPPPSSIPEFLDKYEHLYPATGYTRHTFDAALSARITITPTHSWGW
ncbi:pyridoxamine 5'-phosphate oxidase family protein [Actinoalloteichus sp. AHMU CJ021]|uniref:pyridoxamine 5'-phosphate oxidase family protein n=1 Tax=Actinoalloteichus sp. AHMU CJ021 TaxID=2072503 RepID=UPI0026987846